MILGDDTFETEIGDRFTTGSGDRASVSGQFAGRMTGDQATGTWSARLVVEDAAGEVQDVCEPGLITWDAMRSP